MIGNRQGKKRGGGEKEKGGERRRTKKAEKTEKKGGTGNKLKGSNQNNRQLGRGASGHQGGGYMVQAR